MKLSLKAFCVFVQAKQKPSQKKNKKTEKQELFFRLFHNPINAVLCCDRRDSYFLSF